MDANEVSKWVDALGQGQVEAVLSDLLKAYAEDRSADLASLVTLLGTNASTIRVHATTQREQVLELAARLDKAGAEEVSGIVDEIKRMAADFSAANVVGLLSLLEARSPDPRIATLALHLISEAGAVRELSVNVAEMLARLFVHHAHPGLAAGFKASEARLAQVRRHVYGRFFTDDTRTAVVAKRRTPRLSEADLAALKTAISARARKSLPEIGHEGLMQAICARPDDDAVRAVYADWLLERGDPLGEFITLQLSRAAGRAPKGAAAKEKALLVQHRAEWLGALAKAVALRSIRFERGFLAHAELAGAPPETPMLQLLTSVECTIAQLSSLVTRRQTRWLRSLTLHASEGIDAAADVLSHVAFPKLHTLTLVSVIAHVNEVLPVVFRLESLRSVTTLRFQRGVMGSPSADVLAKALEGTEQIELVDSKRTWTRGSAGWPDTRSAVGEARATNAEAGPG